MKKDLLIKAGWNMGKLAKLGLGTAQEGFYHLKETKQMLAENQQRLEKANEKYQRAVSRVVVTIEKTSELLTLYRRYNLPETALPLAIHHSLEKDFPDVRLKQDGSFIFKGAAAGSAAAASALGGTAVFGAASTGAAISSLHGAAAVSASLAHLGGGSLAAGGLGIAGGIAVLGTTFALPAVAVGSYLWDKGIREQHEQVLAYEKAVDKECSVLQEIYQRYDSFNMHLIKWIIEEQKRLQLPERE